MLRPIFDETWPVLVLPIGQSKNGSSGTFLAADVSSIQWWVKPLNNAQSDRVTVTDYVVGKVGAMIGASVCEVSAVVIPPELGGWVFRPGRSLEEGIAHGSRHVESVVEDRVLRDRDRDNNAVRHAGLLALFDWCWGADPQWLFQAIDDNATFSHDHGHYLPDGPNWTIESLARDSELAHMPVWPQVGLDSMELARIADRLACIQREEVEAVLNGVPALWPVSDAELEALGEFLVLRAVPCAHRLEAIAEHAV